MTPVDAVSNRIASAQLETAPTKHGGESVYLFLEFTIVREFINEPMNKWISHPDRSGSADRAFTHQPMNYAKSVRFALGRLANHLLPAN